MTDERTKMFLSRHISRHEHELGMPKKQAVAVALHEARDKGYDVPPPKGVRAMERKR